MKIKIFFALILLLVVGGAASFFAQKPSGNQIACTADAKLCPDGSAVGRTGPKCEFAACSDSGNGGSGGNGILPYKSGVSGVVTRGPMCPVVRPDGECPDALYETDVMVYRASSPQAVFASTRSDVDGKFLIHLPPGDYIVNATNQGISKICREVSVTVGSDKVESVNISCDTGIR